MFHSSATRSSLFEKGDAIRQLRPGLLEANLIKRKAAQTIGISVDGSKIRAAKIVRGELRFEVAWLKTFDFSVEDVAVERDLIIDLDDLPEESAAPASESEAITGMPQSAGISGLKTLLDLTEGGAIPIVVALSEPDLFYQQFDSDWNLRGKYLLQKIAQEMGYSKAKGGRYDSSELHAVRVDGKRLLAVHCPRHLPVIHKFLSSRDSGNRSVKIAGVRSADLTLVNLVKEFYSPGDGVISIIINIEEKTSRLLFLFGDALLYVAPLVGSGAQLPNIQPTLIHRLQFECDVMNLRKIDAIYLTGAGRDLVDQDVIKSAVSASDIRPLKLHSLGIYNLSLQEERDFGAYTAAVGVALEHADRSLSPKYSVDFTPASVKDNQNQLSLSRAGWLMLAALPIMLTLILMQASELSWELKQSKARLIPKIAQLAATAGIDAEIETAASQLEAFKSAGAMIDSLGVVDKGISRYLLQLANLRQKRRGVWFTEIASSESGVVQMVGYSLSREEIPAFVVEAGAEITKVEAQEIRDCSVYRFEMTAQLTVTQ